MEGDVRNGGRLKWRRNQSVRLNLRHTTPRNLRTVRKLLPLVTQIKQMSNSRPATWSREPRWLPREPTKLHFYDFNYRWLGNDCERYFWPLEGLNRRVSVTSAVDAVPTCPGWPTHPTTGSLAQGHSGSIACQRSCSSSRGCQ